MESICHFFGFRTHADYETDLEASQAFFYEVYDQQSRVEGRHGMQMTLPDVYSEPSTWMKVKDFASTIFVKLLCAVPLVIGIGASIITLNPALALIGLATSAALFGFLIENNLL